MNGTRILSELAAAIQAAADAEDVIMMDDEAHAIATAVVNFFAKLDEQTSDRVGAIAAIGLQAPESLTPEQVRSVCASALTQRPDHS